MNSSLTVHFPHAMQKIYSCWSFWEASPGHPVIVGPPGYKGFVQSSEPQFVEEIMEAMKGAFNVTVTTTEKLTPTDLEHAVDPNYNGKSFYMLRADSWKWTHGILQHEKLERHGCQNPFRVGILNRRGTRSILNAEHIQNELRRQFGDKVHIDTTTFDGLSFREQISWFASHDIIFTGHGAQETGLPFMPKCSVLMEIFPVGYFIPRYFGSLSDSCHVKHFVIYSTQCPDPFGETKNMSETYQERVESRKQNMCPAVGTMLSYLTTAARDLSSCCGNNSYFGEHQSLDNKYGSK